MKCPVCGTQCTLFKLLYRLRFTLAERRAFLWAFHVEEPVSEDDTRYERCTECRRLLAYSERLSCAGKCDDCHDDLEDLDL